ncbi:hypothetical protein [Nocardioides cynanchi]|uniref:hypothetical protein n=1 Tax=Nocardioides cynanchi TaxID=2558918 RepID=UPI00124634F8|nr:hypothetical protein [Nocardioides cynanchi]
MSTTSATHWSRLRRPAVLDPVGVGVVALVVYALHGYDALLTPDLAIFTYGGERMAHGVPPYVGVFNSVGPLADAVPGLAVWLGHLVGAGPLPSVRVVFTLLSALSCALVCVLARDTFGSRAAGLVAPAVFLTFERYLQLASDGPREKTTMVVCLLAALILAGRRRWLGAGVFTALATLTWQPSLLVAVATVVVAIVVSGAHRWAAGLRFVVGGVVTTAAFVVWFALAGSLRQAFDGFVLVNLLYTSQPSAITQPGPTWSMLWAEYHGTLVVALLGLVAMLGLAAAALPAVVRRSAGERSPGPGRVLAVGTGCLAGCLWTLAVINGGPDLFVLLPLAALGLAGLGVLLVERLPRRIGSVAVAAAVCLAVGVAGVEAVSTRNDGLLLQRADVRALLATQPAGATLLSVDAPAVPAIADVTSIWPWQLFDARMLRFLAHTQPGGLSGLAHRFAAARPTFVVTAPHYPAAWPQGVLRRDYWNVGHGPGWTWYLSRTAGRAAFQRAQAANTSAMSAFSSVVHGHPRWTG